MKLSKSQLEALRVLSEQDSNKWRGSGYRGMRTNTLEALVDKGLVEPRLKYPMLDREYRITPMGREHLASLE